MRTIMIKKGFTIRGIFLLVFAWMCNLNISAITFTIGNLKYTTTSDSTVSVSGNESVSGELFIPEKIVYEGKQYTVTKIESSAFFNCSSLTSVTIPKSVSEMGNTLNHGFHGCTNLTAINVDSENTKYCSVDGVLFNKNLSWILCCPEGRKGEYNIPNTVSVIGASAFEFCTELEKIIIPNTVERIGRYAFNGCSKLSEINIPYSVKNIETNGIVFRGDKLEKINVDENNAKYSSKDGVLFNKSQTTLIKYPSGKQGAYTIPNSVTSIEEGAFWGCSGLTSVTIPNSVMSIGCSAFDGCTGLTSVTIPNSVTSIGESAFRDCSGLTFVTIPNSVTSIGRQAFYQCSGLTSVTIPNSVTSIGNLAFYGCSGLTDIYCHIEEPLTIDSSVFYYVPTNTCTLHVPIGSKVKYQAADVWKEFNIVEDLPTGIVSIDNSQLTIDNDVWYTLNGVRLNGKPTIPGIYIVNGLKVVIK